ncbi:cell adhesion molecule 3-like [Mytilus edulis]|uniref:cell adhesion molecule 3-like n=1 Tax=Mytilus edulis TaxID=6550 RepID=UPI0039EE14CF
MQELSLHKTDILVSMLVIAFHDIKPNITPFSPDTLDTEETTSFNVLCHSNGSRPTAFIHWLLGQQQSNVSSNSSTKYMHDSSTDTYTVTSTLKYRVDRIYNGQKLTCRAANVAGSMETSLTLYVKYAPTVNVENTILSYNQSQRQIRSTLDGNPTINTCTWHHRSKYGEHIRDFIVNNQTLTLPTVPKDQWYQDTGEYVCTAENGISGQNGQVKQIGSGYVTSNGRIFFF